MPVCVIVFRDDVLCSTDILLSLVLPRGGVKQGSVSVSDVAPVCIILCHCALLDVFL